MASMIEKVIQMVVRGRNDAAPAFSEAEKQIDHLQAKSAQAGRAGQLIHHGRGQREGVAGIGRHTAFTG